MSHLTFLDKALFPRQEEVEVLAYVRAMGLVMVGYIFVAFTNYSQKTG